MKLLQVGNVANRIGGTGACAWTISRCLPDWDHAFLFVNSGIGVAPPNIVENFGAPVTLDSACRPEHIEAVGPDVILFHNVSPGKMPTHLPGGVPTIYYQHSATKQCVEARRRCDVFWSVSHYLAREANVAAANVVQQPVPRPAAIADPRDATRIGRLCTPQPQKWSRQFLFPFYESMAAAHPSVTWEFVGCPTTMQAELFAACGGRAEFVAPSWPVRSRLWTWRAMLYHGGIESYGRTVCEAQRAGCLPIVDRQGGFVEQIDHGRTGYLCADADEFVRAVGEALSGAGDAAAVAARKAGDDRGSLERWREEFLTWLSAIAA